MRASRCRTPFSACDSRLNPPIEVSLIFKRVNRKLSNLFRKQASATLPPPIAQPTDSAISAKTPEISPRRPGSNGAAVRPKEHTAVRGQRRRRRPKTAASFESSREVKSIASPPNDGRFGDMTVSPQVGRALAEMGYESPTPIQQTVIPLARAGRDVVGQAQTGTGKTAAFGIPLVEGLDSGSREVQALVLVPTRELAVQVTGEVSRLGRFGGIRGFAFLHIRGRQSSAGFMGPVIETHGAALPAHSAHHRCAAS